MGLREYKAKRNFKRTKEPSGTTPTKRPAAGTQFFVVQKHAASRLHYDFRLAMEGVLKSWAVPKGFPTSKGDKRLAIHVEDHPIAYAGFEGTIAEGNYGAGTVMVWDRGTYAVSGDDPIQALKDGKLHLTLSGRKLKGEWTLVRMRGRESDKENWLLLKSGESVPAISNRADDQSVLTRRTLKQIAGANDAQWKSNRAAKARSAPLTSSRRSKHAAPKARVGHHGRARLSRRAEAATKRTPSLPSDGGENRGGEARSVLRFGNAPGNEPRSSPARRDTAAPFAARERQSRLTPATDSGVQRVKSFSAKSSAVTEKLNDPARSERRALPSRVRPDETSASPRGPGPRQSSAAFDGAATSFHELERDCAESQSQRAPICCGWSATQPRSGSGVQCANFSGNSLPKAAPRFVEPMKALLKVDLPRGGGWLYEVKFDGYRALAVKNGVDVKLISRNHKDLGARFPDIAEALRAFPARRAVLDGEVVAVDAQGRPSFQLLQCYHLPGAEKPPLLYYVFDVLNLDGRDLTELPLIRRKAFLESLAPEFPECIRFSAGLSASSDRVLREMKARGLEGIIAKRRDSRYETGRRSGAWVKFKWTFEQEFVIGGYTAPAGTRKHFGAILVGFFERGKLMFSSKVGTGFDTRMLDLLHKKLQPLKRDDCPFANLPEKRSGRFGAGLTVAEMRRCTWVEPKLVCQVRFAEWTRDGHLRQPAFLGLRDDKKPEEVVREVPA